MKPFNVRHATGTLMLLLVACSSAAAQSTYPIRKTTVTVKMMGDPPLE